MNSYDLAKLPEKPIKPCDAQEKLGWVDKYGLYHIDLLEHHVFLDERNFFSRYMWGERQRQEKESIFEAFSKLCSSIKHLLHRNREGDHTG